MTQLVIARRGEISPEVRTVAERESLDPDMLREGLAAGTIVLPVNANRRCARPTPIGAGLRIKVNANIGASTRDADASRVTARLHNALEAGADTVMDLSTAGDLDEIRRAVLAACPVSVGTVPIYQAAVEATARGEGIASISEDELFRVIERQAEEGVDFITVHCGVTQQTAGLALGGGRLTGVVSRGGAFTICWMRENGKENPLYARFDDLLAICRQHDVTLSLGDGLRPGCLADGSDRAQVTETAVLGELVLRAREAGVQSMVEGPGHLPLDHVAANVVLQKRLCHGAPFYVLGPLVTDVTPGYDHITGAIGGAVAGMAGADFLCYLTPAEHLGLPDMDEVRDGVIATRIAAHAADIVRLGPAARRWDDDMARARADLDWESQYALAINPARARERHQPAGDEQEACSMCGPYCVFAVLKGKSQAPK
ncbi:MAG: phosphomethylpyrimidine synthase ThiC [Armatimonadetes bacterium]|nr:phosphomethylpyrimidine synthase ThiC [Armatimonadota bacterium]